MRRRLAFIVLAALVVAVALGALGARDAESRLARALARTEALRTVHFEMRATVRASGEGAAGGALNQEVRASGDIAFPDRLHLVAPIGPPGVEEQRELVVIGERAWSRVGGTWRRVVALSGQNDPRALLDILKGPGAVHFAGYWISGLTPTYHVRIDLDAAALADRMSRLGQPGGANVAGTGRLDVYIGLFDERIYRQETDIEERPGELAPGSGLYRVRTSYAIDYSGFDLPVTIQEPPGP